MGLYRCATQNNSDVGIQGQNLLMLRIVKGKHQITPLADTNIFAKSVGLNISLLTLLLEKIQ